jgi:polygalacturonase
VATCTQDSCLELFELFSGVAKPFCSAYTHAPAHTVHPIAARWAKVPAKISSACSCLNGGSPPTATATPISSKAIVASPTVASSSQPPATPTSAPVDACYVTVYPDIPKAVSSCTSITLDGITVPGNSTIDLSKLKTGTKVTFKGKTFWEYFDANYPFIKVGGTDIEITAAANAVLDGNGNAWWDGLGSNGGVAK